MAQVNQITIKDADGVKRDVATLTALLASTLSVNQVGAAYSPAVSFTRPADTTAYAAGDVVGGVLALTAAGPNGGTMIINGASLEIDIASVPTGMAGFRLYLYSVTPPSALADNAPFDLAAGDRAGFLGFIDLDTPTDFGSTLFVQADNINKQVRLFDASLYGYLVTTGGFTPVNAAVHKVSLSTMAV